MIHGMKKYRRGEFRPSRGFLSKGWGFVAASMLTAGASAQVYGNGSDGALAPTSNLTLDTTANGGVFQFTSIQIPAGVTVHLTGPNPATLLCQGAVNVAGRLDADAPSSLWLVRQHLHNPAGGPGDFAGGGYLQNGSGPGGGRYGQGLYPDLQGA